jgi:predicted  nucleic acid-binding Zn-ribbon protein
MGLNPQQLEKKVLDLEKKLAETDKRLDQKINNVKDGAGGTDSNLLALSGRVKNLELSVNSLVRSVDEINKKRNN